MTRRCTLEFQPPNGLWFRLGDFDFDDEEQKALVLDAAEDLAETLHNCEDPGNSPKMRVTAGRVVLLHWLIQRGWRDMFTGEPA